MKAKDIREMTVDEINSNIDALKQELFALRFQAAANQLENTARLKTVKKDIARLNTVLTQKTAQ